MPRVLAAQKANKINMCLNRLRFRRRRASGSKASPSAIGKARRPDGLRSGRVALLWEGTVTDNVTFVAPEPAGTDVGEKVAVAPVGSPETENVIAAGVVSPLGGVTASV